MPASIAGPLVKGKQENNHKRESARDADALFFLFYASQNLLIFVSPGCAELGYDSAMKIPTLFKNYIHVLLKRSALLPVVVLLACFALLPQARAVCLQGCDLGNDNTFFGDDALLNNTVGTSNTAQGFRALYGNTSGSGNTAIGDQALVNNFTGNNNTAVGYFALLVNRGINNTATGRGSLLNNSTGSSNTAIGFDALVSSTIGHKNIAVGSNAGAALTIGSYNIDIGNPGIDGESNTIRIGQTANQTATYVAGISGATVPSGVAVVIDGDGHLGTTTSSARFKEAIKPMDKASEAILALQPVTFRYKHELDANGVPQFGLVAEEVAKVNPDLVARDEQGKPYTVRYDAVNAMLLNEFLKEHRTVRELKSIVANQEATAAHQQKQIEALTAGLQKVSAQLEVSKSAPQTVDSR